MRLSPLRQIEELGRRALFGAIAACSRRSRSMHAALPRRPMRVLFIMEDAIGDTILTLPAMRAIVEAHPGNVLDVVTWDTPAELLRGAPYVRRVIVFPRHDRRRVNAGLVVRRHGPYDAVVDGMVLCRHVRSRSFAMMLASGAAYWVGEGDRGSDYLLNTPVPRPAETIPHLERMLAMAEPFRTTAVRDRRPLLTVTPDERFAADALWGDGGFGARVLINVSTNGSERRWPLDSFCAVARHVRRTRRDARIAVVGLARDRAMAEQVALAADTEAFVPSIRELVALVESAHLVISPDTAVCHMASAFARPLVSMHNAGKEQWLPFDTPGVRVIGTETEDLASVSPAAVCDAVDSVFHSVRVTAAVAS